MKTFLILGGGTGGTMVANKMSHHLDPAEWKIIVVDQNENHYYQPGLLFIPFGIYNPSDVVKPKRDFYPQNVEFVLSKIEMIEPDQNRVKLEKGKRTITYDTLVIATGNAARWQIAANNFLAINAAGPFMFNTAGTSGTTPIMGPNRGDNNTGIGHVADDNLSLIAGGLEGVRIEDPADLAATETSLWLFDDDNAAIQQVTVGIADSGGAGFKVLRIVN